MINLIRNENLKLSRKLSTWIMVGILILIVIAAGVIIKTNAARTSNNNWRTHLAEANLSLQKQIDNPAPGMASSVLENMKREVETNSYRLKHNIPPIESNSIWGFVSGASSVISLIALFAIIMGGGIVANEFSSGTIKLLLIRPSRRWKILLSKYFAVLAYIILMLVILFIVSFILGGILFSFKGATLPYLKNVDGTIMKVNMVAHTLGVYGLECVNLIMMVTLAFMISTVFRNSSLAIGLGVFLLLTGSALAMLLSRFSFAKFLLFANTDLKQYVNGTPLIHGMTMSFSITVLIVYFIIFNLISFLGFTKRDVAA